RLTAMERMRAESTRPRTDGLIEGERVVSEARGPCEREPVVSEAGRPSEREPAVSGGRPLFPSVLLPPPCGEGWGGGWERQKPLLRDPERSDRCLENALPEMAPLPPWIAPLLAGLGINFQWIYTL